MKFALTSVLMALFSMTPLRAGDRSVNYQEAGFALLSLARPVDNPSDVVERQSIEGIDYKDSVLFALSNLDRSGFYLESDEEWLSHRGRILLTISDEIRTASLEDVRRLAGAIGRQEKFNPGLVLKAMQSGTYRAMYLRFKQLNPR